MTWEEKEKKFGKPIRGQVYNCKLQGASTGRIVEEKLKCIAKDDVFWRIADDNSEIDEFNWDVIEWSKI